MLPRTYESQNCSIARALEVLGDRWTILVMRDAFMRVRRFDDFVEEGILERVRYQERPARFEYRLTDKGLELWPVMMTLLQWGDRYYAAPEGPPVAVRHRDCGGEITSHLTCAKCGAELGARDATAAPGPGALVAA